MMMSSGLSEESVKLRESGPVVFKGVLQDGNENTTSPTVNTIAVDIVVFHNLWWCDEDWLEKNVNYLRLQELRLSLIA